MIFFDLDGTLFDHNKAVEEALALFLKEFSVLDKKTGVDLIKLWSEVSDQYYKKYRAGEMSFTEQRNMRIKTFFLNFGIKLSEQEASKIFSKFLQHYENNWQLFPDVIFALNELKRHPLGIISNGNHEQQIKKLTHLGIIDYFEPIITSGLVNAFKPDRKIFIKACEKANMLPKKCIYIGDDLETDAIGSKQVGMIPFLIDRSDSLTNLESGITCIKSLSEFPKLL